MSDSGSSVVGEFLDANRVALIGATSGVRDAWSYNARMTRSLLRSSFEDVVLISRREQIIHGRVAHGHIGDVPGGEGDLGVIVVPHKVLPTTIAECADAGWRRVLAITGQLDADDRMAINQIIPSSARLWGPNCTGFFSAERNRRVMAIDYEPANRKGRKRIAVAGQSGGALNNIAVMAESFGLNISHILSTGEEMDVGVEDMLTYLAHSRDTDAAVVFVEQARRPEFFLQALDDCARSEIPVIVLKVGRTHKAKVAAHNHTDSIVGDADEFEALVLDRGGIICESFREAAGVAAVATHSRRRPGRRVAFFTSSGGTNVLVCDLAERNGLRFADLSPASSEAIYGLSLSEVESINPFDSAIAGGTPRSLPRYLDQVTRDEGVDTMMLLHGGDIYGELITRQLEGHMPSAKTMLAVWPGVPAELRERLLDVGVAVLEDPSESCRWLGLAAAPAYLSEGSTEVPSEAVPSSASLEATTQLEYGEASRLLRKSVVDVPMQWYVDSANELDAVVLSIDRFPLFVKASSMPGHKAQAGGVQGGVRSTAELQEVARELVARYGRIAIEEEAPRGVEIMVAVRDGPLGGIVLAGFGGAFADVFGKQVLLPASSDAATLAKAIARSPISLVLAANLGTAALATAHARIAATVVELVALCRAERLASVEINPLIVSATRAVACDVKMEKPRQIMDW